MGRTSCRAAYLSRVALGGGARRALRRAFAVASLVLTVCVLSSCSGGGSPFGEKGRQEGSSRASSEAWEFVRDIWTDVSVPAGSGTRAREWRRTFRGTFRHDPRNGENDTVSMQEDSYDDQGRVVLSREYSGERLQTETSWEYDQDVTRSVFRLFEEDGSVRNQYSTTSWTEEDGTEVVEQTDASGELEMRREVRSQKGAPETIETDKRWVPSDEEKSSLFVTAYDSEGRVEESRFYQGGTTEEEALLYWATRYDYDPLGREVGSGRLVVASPYSEPWLEYTQYASDDGKVTMRLENPKGASLADKIYFTAYDEKGRPYYISTFYAGSAEAAGDPTEDFISYNEDGNPTEIVRQSYGVTVRRRTFAYDDDANLLYSVESRLDDEGQLQQVIYNIYQYQTVDGAETTERADLADVPCPQIDSATRYEPLNQSVVMARELHYPEDGIGWWESDEDEGGVSVGVDFTSMVGAEPAVRIFVRREGTIARTSYASYAKRPDGELVVVGRDGARVRIRQNNDGSLAIVGTLGDGTAVDVDAVRHIGLLS